MLQGTGLADWNIEQSAPAITPQQYLRLVSNVADGLKSADTSFLLGQQMLPGHFGAVSHALMQAGSLRQAIRILTRYPVPLCPLMTPRFAEEGGLAALYWSESFGTGALRGFAVEMHMTAFSAMCRWLSGERLPWQFCFNRTQPRHTEQHEVHLGPHLRFNCHVDALVIDAQWLDRPWPRGSNQASALALLGAGPELQRRGLLSAVYDYLEDHIRSGPTLEQTAAAYQVSPATFKRYLARHGTHFQSELDQVRAHVTLRLMHRGQDNETIARHLGFHDANNFRRSFKRWTGITPMLLRQGLNMR